MQPDILPREEENQEIAYSMEALQEAAEMVSRTLSELPGIRRRTAPKIDKGIAKEHHRLLSEERDKLLTGLMDIVLALREMELPDLADYAAGLHAAVSGFNLMTKDYTMFCAGITDFLAKLPAWDNKACASVIARLMNSVRMGYYPTDLGHIKMLVRGIQFPEIATNLFDPCCGCGLALRSLAEGNGCYTYGIELDGARAEEAQSRLHRVGFGSYFHSRVSHEAFHVLLLNPPYLSVLGRNEKRVREEKAFLVKSYETVMLGGLIIYIIPYYRLTPDICRILCDNFADITMWRFCDAEFSRFNQIAIMGTRQKRIDGSSLMDGLLDQIMHHRDTPELSGLPENRYMLPEHETKVDVFKGAEFNVKELAAQLRKSNSLSKLCEASRLESKERRPLLPLNISQIGLIGGSGLINGLVEGEYPHIIKGRVIKESRKWTESIENRKNEAVGSETHVITSNKMIFNVLTPNGIKTLLIKPLDDLLEATIQAKPATLEMGYI